MIRLWSVKSRSAADQYRMIKVLIPILFLALASAGHPAWALSTVSSEVLERMALYGNTRIRSRVILREIGLFPGKSFDTKILNRERAWLLRQDFLQRIEFQVKPGSIENGRVLILIVQEKPVWSMNPIINENDLFGWTAGLTLTRTNLGGFRNRIDLSGQMGGIDRLTLAWSNPWFGGPLRLFGQAEIGITRYRYLFGDVDTPFDDAEAGFLFGLGIRPARPIRLGCRIGIDWISVSDSRFAVSGGRADTLVWTEPFLLLDSRDWPYYPKTGFVIHAWFRSTRTWSRDLFRRAGVDFRMYRPAFKDNIIAFQTEIQISDGQVPAYRRIHLGGGKTIRGFPIGALAGEHSVLAAVEYRFPLVYERNPLAGIHAGYAGVLFLDAGTAWFGTEPFLVKNLRLSAGFGVHAIWDHWVIRLEYGHNGEGWGFVRAGTGTKF